MSNTVMEWKFCRLFGGILKKSENVFYGAEFAFFWRVAESALSDYNSVLVNLRSPTFTWELPWSVTNNMRTIQFH